MWQTTKTVCPLYKARRRFDLIWKDPQVIWRWDTVVVGKYVRIKIIIYWEEWRWNRRKNPTPARHMEWWGQNVLRSGFTLLEMKQSYINILYYTGEENVRRWRTDATTTTFCWDGFVKSAENWMAVHWILKIIHGSSSRWSHKKWLLQSK